MSWVWNTAPSPSQTADWVRCPQYATDRRAGWRGRSQGKPAAVAMLSTAWHAGLAEWYLTGDCERMFQVGMDTYRHDQAQAAVNGVEWSVPPYPESLLETVLTTLVPPPFQHVIGVELACLPNGRARMDLLTPQGPVDHKMIILSDPRYLSDRLKGFHTSDQARDYLWRANQLFAMLSGGTHPLVLTCRFHVCVLIEEYDMKKRKKTGRFEAPFAVVEPVTVTQEELDRWEQDMIYVWGEMAKRDSRTRRVRAYCSNDGYGRPCEYYSACWGVGMNDIEYFKEVSLGVGSL